MNDTASQEQVIQTLKERYPHQPEFLQAVDEVCRHVSPLLEAHPIYNKARIFERLTEPDRTISFRVTWQDDNNNVHINRGWRVQHSNLIGPYKGGLRFHPKVNESVLKFLAFEQCFKNALTGLPIGGGKGGSDFDPKGRSEHEIMRFCQAFMNELQRHIGPCTDVPAGDINVGSREIGFLYGQYRRLHNEFGGVLTGKELEFGGSHVRLEATGYGLVYFLKALLKDEDESIDGKVVAISGAGNVACHAAKKAISEGAKVVSLSNSKGTLYCENGFEIGVINDLINHRQNKENPLQELAQNGHGKWLKDEKPWRIACDIAAPCATENELLEEDAKRLAENSCKIVIEGANMPCSKDALTVFEKAGITFVPGKASNAGGVALSGLEMSQNANFQSHEFEDLDANLRQIMGSIHQLCKTEGEEKNRINYAKGADIAAFKRLADAMLAQGI
ncbi:NADP-specific glutamate dehydrogenase [Aliiglaciecola sp. CAU 1673]|uniref:NADP-specific glutamate dehydrogenase n=1 Tax=Aliiglaciecola sp. CAU 1673 TaxID=3032595 RepID=UPI0023D97AB4|nr:NADP-specific glutamate dehydrogenase [Aliiglaciecola sp. CAU 1673]MDF2179547.1 NADP-specific glutamate dehydrogenase [Aliiglaciecola sp. CAU 1673]